MLKVVLGPLPPRTLAEATRMVQAFWPEAERLPGVLSVYSGWTYRWRGDDIAKVEKIDDTTYKVTFLVQPEFRFHAEVSVFQRRPR